MKFRFMFIRDFSIKIQSVFPGIVYKSFCFFLAVLLSTTAFAQDTKNLHKIQNTRRLTLLECLDIAMEQNPVVKSARERMTKSRLKTREAYASIFPKLYANFEYTYTDSPDSPYSMFMLSDENYTFSLDLQQPLYDQGKYSVLKQQAGLDIEISQLDLESVKQGISLDVISAYLDILKAEEMINIARESRERLTEHLRVTERRFEVGQVAKNDVLRAEMELANAESDLIQAQKGIALAYEYLKRLLSIGDEPFTIMPITKVNINESHIPKKDTDANRDDPSRSRPREEVAGGFSYKSGTEEMIGLAYMKRPDYLMISKKKELSGMDVSLAKRDFFPFVSLFGRYEKNGERFFPDDYDALIVGGKIDLPIFEGGIRGVRLRRARHDFSLSEYQEEELMKRIKVEVVEAAIRIEELEAKLKAIDKQIEHAQENLRIVQLRYQEGEATNLDALDANLLLVKAKTDFAALNYDLIKARFARLKAIGDLGMDRIRQAVDIK